MLKDDFLHYLSAEKNYSAATVKEYGFALSAFGDFVEKQGRDLNWETIRDGDIREWIVFLMDKGSAASTVNTWLSALRSFYRYLLGRCLVKHDPTLRIEGPKKKRSLPYFVKESEMDKLLDSVKFGQDYEGLRDHFILLMLYSTGIRLAELIGMDTVALDFGSHTLKVTGKRNKQRVIPMGQELEDEARIYLDVRKEYFCTDDGPMFLNKKGTRASRTLVENTVKRYLGLVTTQIKRSPHVLRHSFATAMLNHGAEIGVLKELLGHESIATTEIYTHTTFEELKKIYNNAHPRA